MRTKIATVLGLLALAGVARASKEGPTLFGEEWGKDLDPKARAAVGKVVEECAYSMFSRIGPMPGQVAKCNAAEERAISLGVPAARAAVARLDESISDGARGRLYDIVARAGDVTFIEPLVVALERSSDKPMPFMRSMDRHSLNAALSRITFAGVGERAPWVSDAKPADGPAWRAWLNAHRNQSRDQLLADRVARSRANAAAPGVEPAFLASQFLSQQPATRGEGLAALQALLGRPSLGREERTTIQSAIQRVAPPQAPTQAVAKGEPRV
jgi:hypothetical protein